jgi:mono/diheme cytochrome c family protein
MRLRSLLALFPGIALAVCLALPQPAFADGAATYKTTCGKCHGPDGGPGKVAPAVKGTKLSADEIVALLTKGNDTKKPPHKKGMANLSAEDAKAVAEYVKSLK